MGLFKGSIASLVSGKVGGLVYQRNGRIRTYRLPLNPRTTAQDLVRGAFIQASGLWSTLSQELQAAWQTYGLLNPKINRIGDSKVLTGKQCLIGLNVPRLQARMDPISTPPSSPINITPVGNGPVGDIVVGDGILSISAMSVPATYVMTFYVGKPRSMSSVRGRKSLAYVGKVNGAVVPITTVTLALPTGVSISGQVYDLMCVLRGPSFNVSTYFSTLVVT